MVGSTIRRLFLAVATLAAATAIYGCSQTAAATTTCQGTDQQNCEARDNARQERDAQDYQNEPALGYLASPPGMLPVPLTARNASAN